LRFVGGPAAPRLAPTTADDLSSNGHRPRRATRAHGVPRTQTHGNDLSSKGAWALCACQWGQAIPTPPGSLEAQGNDVSRKEVGSRACPPVRVREITAPMAMSF